MKELDPATLESRREVEFPITFKGLMTGYETLLHKKPVEGFQWLVRKAEKLTVPMMTGYASLVSMPLGIMGRNGARVAYDASKGRYAHAADVIGVASAGGGWWLAGSFAYSKIMAISSLAATTGATATAASTIVKVCAIAAATVAASPVIVPAFTLGVLATSAAVGLTATALSVIPAAANLGVAWKRSMDRIKGIKYDEQGIKEAIAQSTLEDDYNGKRLYQMQREINYLPENSQRAIYESLKERFNEVTVKADSVALQNNTPVASIAAPSKNTP